MVKIIIVQCFAVYLLLSCGTAEVNPGTEVQGPNPKTRPVDIAVFIDVSASVNYKNTTARSAATKKLTALLRLLTKAGDRISFYFLHANTSGGRPIYSYAVPDFIIDPGWSKIERIIHERKHKAKVSAGLSGCRQKFNTYLDTVNDESTKKNTDVIAVMEVAGRDMYPSGEKYLLILSDGVQTAHNLKCSPGSNAEAANTAIMHIKKMKSIYRINRDILNNIVAYMILPHDPLSTRHNKYLDIYWEMVFKEFGITLKIQ